MLRQPAIFGSVNRIKAFRGVVEHFLFVAPVLGEFIVVVAPGIGPGPPNGRLDLRRQVKETLRLLPQVRDQRCRDAVIDNLEKAPVLASLRDLRRGTARGVAGRALIQVTDIDDRNGFSQPARIRGRVQVQIFRFLTDEWVLVS